MVPLGAVASVFSRDGRSKWYAKLRDPETGVWKSVVTPFRLHDVAGKRKALVWAGEQDRVGEAVKASASDRWEWWVVDWLNFQYADQESTLAMYLREWSNVYEFLTALKIKSPHQVLRQHAQMFVEWRLKHRRKNGRKVTRLTAINGFTLFRLVMTQAVDRDIVPHNPLFRTGMARRAGKEKPEITAPEDKIIRHHLRQLPESKRWMRISYLIAMHQGCRKSETSLPLTDINLEKGTIMFRAKGNRGEKHVFTTALHPRLKHLIRWLKASGVRMTCEIPPVSGPYWTGFFRRIGLPHLCFHCTRVTVITKLARAGVSEQKAIRFIGHADHTIHRVYQRLVAEDVADVAAAI